MAIVLKVLEYSSDGIVRKGSDSEIIGLCIELLPQETLQILLPIVGITPGYIGFSNLPSNIKYTFMTIYKRQ